MSKTVGTTVYSTADFNVPHYAVRRESDGYFLDNNGNFIPMLNEFGDRNDYDLDYRVSASYWVDNGVSLEGCQVVAVAIATVITASPVNW